MELYNILIFSESEACRKSLSTHLTRKEFSCQTTDSIEEARSLMQMAEEIHSPFTACLLDWDSPNESSRKLWNELNRDSRFNNTIIVFLADQVNQNILEVAFHRKNSEVYGKNTLEVVSLRLLKLIRSRYLYPISPPSKNIIEGRTSLNSVPKNSLLASIDYKFRTQMNNIMGIVNMLQSTDLSQEQKDYVEIIEKSSSSLNNILYDVIDYSRIGTGDFNIESSLFEIQDAPKKIIELFKIRAEKQQIELSLNFDPDTPCLVLGDYKKICQVFYNLISNAVKYTLHGHIMVHISCQEQKEDAVNLRFEILDTGVGIDDEILERMNLFFEDREAQLPSPDSGVGLGLYITKQLLGLMGATLHVIGQRGEGTTVWFNLNMKCQIERREDKQASDSIPRIPTRKEDHQSVLKRGNKRHYKILIVEDDIVNQKVIALLIQKNGYKFDISSNGVDAINKLSRNAYDLVLMDLTMPEMDGLETTQLIRDKSSNVLNNMIPIIGMTAHTAKGYKEMSEQVGMDTLIFKPFDEIELSILLHKYLIESDLKGAVLDQYVETAIKEDNASCSLKNSHLNIKAVIQMYEEFGDEVLALLEMFKVEFGEKLKKIQQAVQEKNPEILKEVAHSLKSNSATFGANELFEICLQFEIMGRNNSCQGAKELLEDLEEEGKRVLEELSKIDFKACR